MQTSSKVNSLINNSYFIDSKPYISLLESPLTFVDIGSRGGAHSVLAPIAKFTNVLGFEPDELECKALHNNPDSIWSAAYFLPCALYNADKDMKFYVTNEPNNSSLLQPNKEFVSRYNMEKWKVITECNLKTTTLDKALSLHNKQNYGEFIKLDTQGTEFGVLDGSSATLTNNCVAALIEVSFRELYSKQKRFSEIEVLMREKGFSFYGFTSMHNRSKKLLDKKQHIYSERLIYADALFFKDPVSLNLTERQSYVAFVIALLNNYLDFALEIASYTWLKNSDTVEQERIHKLIYKLSFNSNESSIQEVKNLYTKISSTPDYGNVLVGSFVDSKRGNCDYNDILNVSPLPKHND